MAIIGICFGGRLLPCRVHTKNHRRNVNTGVKRRYAKLIAYLQSSSKATPASRRRELAPCAHTYETHLIPFPPLKFFERVRIYGIGPQKIRSCTTCRHLNYGDIRFFFFRHSPASPSATVPFSEIAFSASRPFQPTRTPPTAYHGGTTPNFF